MEEFGCIHSLDWTAGLEHYWTDIFLAFTHVVVGLIDPQLLRAFREFVAHCNK